MADFMANLAPAYSTSKTYESGNRVLYNNKLYQCTKSTSGTFDASAWTSIYVSDLIKGGLNSNLGGNSIDFSNPIDLLRDTLFTCPNNGIIISKFGTATVANAGTVTFYKDDGSIIIPDKILLSSGNEHVSCLNVSKNTKIKWDSTYYTSREAKFYGFK